jgi:hypothetical protein
MEGAMSDAQEVFDEAEDDNDDGSSASGHVADDEDLYVDCWKEILTLANALRCGIRFCCVIRAFYTTCPSPVVKKQK